MVNLISKDLRIEIHWNDEEGLSVAIYLQTDGFIFHMQPVDVIRGKNDRARAILVVEDKFLENSPFGQLNRFDSFVRILLFALQTHVQIDLFCFV